MSSRPRVRHLFIALLVSCASAPPTPPPAASKPASSAGWSPLKWLLEGETKLETCTMFPAECEKRAAAGDARAASYMYLTVKDPLERLRWAMTCAKLGGDLLCETHVLEQLGPTGAYPDATRRAEFVEMGVGRGHPLALREKAAGVQDVDPGAAVEMYGRAARVDDCVSQLLLAGLYLDGVGTTPNAALALFWWTLGVREHGESYKLGLPSNGASPSVVKRLSQRFEVPDSEYTRRWFNCSSRKDERRFVALRTAPFGSVVTDAVLAWRPGQQPLEALSLYAGEQSAEAADAPLPLATPPPAAAVRASSWQKKRLPATRAMDKALAAEDIYARVSPSVYVVMAAPSPRDLLLRQRLAQGSAVAVDRATLLTNCHIIDGRPSVSVRVGQGSLSARVVAADVANDTCILQVSGAPLNPVPGVRSSFGLRVGEPVFAIGSPSGLTNSLSAGLISQVREERGRKFVQTTAQISPGSSGGGLFDRFGNLIGITSFKVAGGEGLNFAISVNEFLDLPRADRE